MTKQALSSSILGTAIVSLWTASALAGEIKVRDAALRLPRDVHQFCVIASSDNASAKDVAKQLEVWLDGPGSELNLELVTIDAKDPNVRWMDYGIPAAPDPSMLPVVVLIGRNRGSGETRLLDFWEPSPNADDLATLKESPLRQQLQQQLGQRLAVILYAPGNSRRSGLAQEVVDRVVEKWSKRGPLGVSAIRVDRNDERERTLLSFMMGQERFDSNADDWVGLLFGRGKLLNPPLRGKQITSDRLNQMIDLLTKTCSSSKPIPTMGPDIPMTWHEELDKAIVWISDPDEQASVLLEAANRDQPLAANDGGTRLDSSVMATMLWTLGGVALAVVASLIVIFRRKRSET